MVRSIIGILLTTAIIGTLVLAATRGESAARIGQQAATSLKKNLMGALVKALQDGGVPSAVKVCSAEAMELTRKSGEVNPAVISIQRRTERWRNPGNKADAMDLEAMKAFEQDKELTEIVRSDEEGITRYYQPLRTMPLCLQCHGNQESFSSELKEVLKKYYPNDQAVGYAGGDLRGVIQVRIRD